jgi:hypothetical protein
MTSRYYREGESAFLNEGFGASNPYDYKFEAFEAESWDLGFDSASKRHFKADTRFRKGGKRAFLEDSSRRMNVYNNDDEDY